MLDGNIGRQKLTTAMDISNKLTLINSVNKQLSVGSEARGLRLKRNCLQFEGKHRRGQGRDQVNVEKKK